MLGDEQDFKMGRCQKGGVKYKRRGIGPLFPLWWFPIANFCLFHLLTITHGLRQAITLRLAKKESTETTKKRFYSLPVTVIVQKMKSSIRDFFSKCDQIRRKLADLVTFTEEIFNGNFYLCSVQEREVRVYSY